MFTPAPLCPGARVALVAPSSAVPAEKLEPALAFVRSLGLEPEPYPSCFFANRDGYLAAQPDGPALIREYYRIAPAIVTCIDLCTEHTVRYRQLREKYLSPCYDDLLHGRQAQCKRRYVRMVRALEREFLGRERQ